MTIKQLISNKQSAPLTEGDAKEFVADAMSGKYTNRQLAEFVKFCCNNKFTDQEVYTLASAMAQSGVQLYASQKLGFCVDEYSFSNVPDGMSLVLMSVLASLGFRCTKCVDEIGDASSDFFNAIKTKPFASPSRLEEGGDSLTYLFSGKNKLAPLADVLYDFCYQLGEFCEPIIAACILAKKIAIGASIVLIDAKSGEGSQFKIDQQQVQQVANRLVNCGKLAGQKFVAVVTDFNWSISASIGNLPLMGEIWDTLSGSKEYLASNLLVLTKEVAVCALLASNLVSGRSQAAIMVDDVIKNGRAFDRLKKIGEQFGLKVEVASRHNRLIDTAVSYITADFGGYVEDIKLGQFEQIANNLVGKGKTADYAAGIVLMCAEGDRVSAGDKLAQVLYSHNNNRYFKYAEGMYNCFKIGNTKPANTSLFYKVVI